ncbi:MAG: hypothetical protein GY795_07055 [Desulfobacterales bacterium]|nr:hypothetical protein [Desulfobacterales bacterium]
MLKNNTIIRITVICLFLFFWGCGGESEPEKPDEVRKKISVKAGDQKTGSESGEVRKKIVLAKSAPQPKKAGDPSPETADKAADKLAPEPVKPVPGKEESKPKSVKQPKPDDKTGVPAASSRKPEPSDKKDIPGKEKKETKSAVQPETPAKEDKPAKKEQEPDKNKPELAKKEEVAASSESAETEKSAAQPETAEASLPDSEVAAKDDKQPSDEEKSPAPAEQPEPAEEASPATPASASDEPEKPVDEKAIASIIGLKKSFNKKQGYDSTGKIDPFVPLFKEEKPVDREALEAQARQKKKKKKRIRRKRKTPLEKIDLSNLQLKAIIRAQSGNRALVEDSTQKGYIITKGTHIGIHYGKVKEILSDRVVVEEEDEDAYGEVTLRERVIKIMKPPGEDYMEM